MRRILATALIVVAYGCTKGPALPEQPVDDPSTRTTTLVGPANTPEELAVQCDVPIYPGAKAPDGMSRLPKKNPDGTTSYDLVLTSGDKLEKVTDFYAGKLNVQPVKHKDGNLIMGKTPKKNDAIVTLTSEGGQTVIRINAIVSGH